MDVFRGTAVAVLALTAGLLAGCARNWPAGSVAQPHQTPDALLAEQQEKKKFGPALPALNWSETSESASEWTPEPEPASSWTTGLRRTRETIAGWFDFSAPVKSADATSLSSMPEEIGYEVYLHAGRLQEGIGNRQAALDQYQKALSVAPNNLPTLICIARFYDREGRFDLATSFYQQAVSAHSNNPLAWNDLGLCYARQRKLDAAVSALQRSVQLAPQNARYRNNLATVLVEAQQYDAALAELQVVHPPAVAHYNLATLLHRKQQFDLAAHHCQIAVQQDPGFAAAQEMLRQLARPVNMAGPSAAPAPQSAQLPTRMPLPQY